MHCRSCAELTKQKITQPEHLTQITTYFCSPLGEDSPKAQNHYLFLPLIQKQELVVDFYVVF